ncbi:MAG: L-2-hydroxyglutarate oxidase [Oceanicoccus sp.]|jgi:L-2-hydroxyglutarate oxidase
MTPSSYDYTIIGGGIIGISTALQLKQKRPDASIIVLEKERALACHQTGHNSGVIHAGVYYAPGSLKADFCKRGAQATMKFCDENAIAYKQCGKLIVATTQLELKRMQELEQRCIQNGIECISMGEAALREKEPNINGLGALEIPQSGIVDYREITRCLARHFVDAGGVIALNSEVSSVTEHDQYIEITSSQQVIRSKFLISCTGLMADRLCKMLGIPIDFAIVPFRGEYYRLPTNKQEIVKQLIYPVPDPAMPFLGVHLTLMIDGSITIGPNAVVGWKREGYDRFNFNVKDTLEMLSFSGFWKMAAKNIGSGLNELKNSLHVAGYLKLAQKYCPTLILADLLPYPAGVRAQAVMRDGSLVQDFLFAESNRSLHVCNAPSPAATSAFPIGEYIVGKTLEKMSATAK